MRRYIRTFAPTITAAVLGIGLAILTLCVFSPGCATVQTQPPQATIAHYGADILAGITGYQSLLVKATEGPTPLMTVEKAKPQMDAIRTKLDQAQKLSDLLKAYDTATGAAKTDLVSQINAALSALQVLGVDPTSLPAQLVAEGQKLVANVVNLVNQTKAAIAAGRM